MKKLTALLLSLTAALVFSGCGQQPPQANQELSFAEPAVALPEDASAVQGQNPIVNIVDRTKTEGLAYGEALEKIFEDEDSEFYLSGVYSHYVIVHYENGSQEDIMAALDAGRASIADLDRFSIGYIREAKNADSSIPYFSYEEVLLSYPKDTPGVKYDGFVNGPQCEVKITTSQQAIDRAKLECTIEYNMANVSYDGLAEIWCVDFWQRPVTPGGGQSVYLDSSGGTCLIVYGE